MSSEALSSHEVFSFLQPQQLKAVSDVSEVVDLRKGATIFTSGETASFLYAVLEGEVDLELPRGRNVNLHIERISTGSLFGSCICFDLASYTLTATCATDAKLLKIDANELKRVMDDDAVTGYHLQRMISRTYFRRYLDTMEKLRNIASSLELTAR